MPFEAKVVLGDNGTTVEDVDWAAKCERWKCGMVEWTVCPVTERGGVERRLTFQERWRGSRCTSLGDVQFGL